ncbi:MAG TPA: alpha/beta fold hydrolase, partial [Methylomirabilota bacterium]
MKLQANGIDINYEIEGEGPVVTFSHSLACNLSMWDEQVRALAGRYRVLRYDTRGHGGTSAPAGAYTLDQLCEDVKALLDALGIRETHFVGLSMGGMVGQVFALKHPAMVQSLT